MFFFETGILIVRTRFSCSFNFLDVLNYSGPPRFDGDRPRFGIEMDTVVDQEDHPVSSAVRRVELLLITSRLSGSVDFVLFTSFF